MKIERLGIEGAWIGNSQIHKDERGFFREWYRSSDVELALGGTFEVAQSNISMSHFGALRGIHYSMASIGQGKLITCISGSIWDVVVDIRPLSPTYRKWIGIPLSEDSGDVIIISEGLGHGFISLEDNSMVSYMLTSPYSPSEEYEINPFDTELAIKWPITAHVMSKKDASAPTLLMRQAEGRLPGIN